jgi:hypothetical protein
MTCAPQGRRRAIGHDAMQGRKRKRVGDGPSDGAKSMVAMLELSCSTARSRAQNRDARLVVVRCADEPSRSLGDTDLG